MKELRIKLFLRYALVILFCSGIIFIGGYKSYKVISLRIISESLTDYLAEEKYEFEHILNDNKAVSEVDAIDTGVDNLHYFTYWRKNGNLIHSELPNGKVGDKIKEILQNWQNPDNAIKELKMRINGIRWRFLAVSQSWFGENDRAEYQVISLINISPYIYISHRYKSYGIISVLLLIIISLSVAWKLADNAIKPMLKAYENQQKFVSDASHELKTPLSVLMTYSELMEKQPNEKNLAVIKQEIKNMANLVDDLLSLTRLEYNTKTLTPESIDLNQKFSEIVQQFNEIHKQRKNPLTATVDTGLQIKMVPTHLDRLINIMLDNAAKYSRPEDKISITANSENGKIILRFSDTGIGIAKEDLPHIFERFYRADKSHNRKITGFGLGLPLACEIVKKYNGQILVESELEKGTTFTIII